MIGDVIGIGSRVKINTAFGTGKSDADSEHLEYIRSLVGADEVEKSRLEVVGQTGTVMCIHSHSPWPYTVALDEGWVCPAQENELDVIDDLDALAAALTKEDARDHDH